MSKIADSDSMYAININSFDLQMADYGKNEPLPVGFATGQADRVSIERTSDLKKRFQL